MASIPENSKTGAAGDDTDPGNIYEGHDLEALSDMPNYYSWIADLFRPYLHGRALEIGAGIGTNAEYTRQHVEHLALVEPSPNLVTTLQERFGGDPQFSVHGCTSEDYLAEAEPGSRDAVMMINVLEHIEDDRQTARQIHDLLSPGGHFLIFVPAMPFLFSKLDSLFGHYRRYTRPALRSVLEDSGFEIVESRYFDILGIAPWYILNTLMGSTGFNPSLVTLYDRVGVPVTRTFERIVNPPVGKNLVMIGRKSPAAG
jgi:SAM-dependent methyltransferase